MFPHDSARRPGRPAAALLAALLVVALALVTPASGLSRAGAHDFMSVHLLLPHHHHEDVAHGQREPAAHAVDDGDNDYELRTQPALTAATALADALSVGSSSLLGAVAALALLLRVSRLAPGHKPLPLRIRAVAVPTRPPR